MFSVLLPMGDSPFFVNACLANLFETSGLPAAEIDFHFLTVEPISPCLDVAFQKASRKYRFNVHARPFGRKRNKAHTMLLDWGMENLGLSDWVYVTHTDMFWLDQGWMKELIAARHPKVVALMMPYNRYRGEFKYAHHKFALDHNQLVRTHDFSGLYYRPTILEMNLKFVFGAIGTDLPISAGLSEAIRKSRIHWLRQDRSMVVGDVLDGADLIGLELAVQRPGSVIEPPIKSKFVHGWDTLGLADDMERDGGVLTVNRRVQKCQRGLTSYSWISSHLFDKMTSQVIFPWSVLCKIAPQVGFKTDKTALCKIVEKYADTENVVVGDTNNFGIETVVFSNRNFRIA